MIKTSFRQPGNLSSDSLAIMGGASAVSKSTSTGLQGPFSLMEVMLVWTGIDNILELTRTNCTGKANADKINQTNSQNRNLYTLCWPGIR